jgi:enamine deaminase RidA (YjgF/YER057c/UK114 family)
MRIPLALGVFLVTAVSTSAQVAPTTQAPPSVVTFSGSPRSPISSNVAVPANKAYFWTSGTVPSVADESAPAGSPARFGDTKAQGISILRTIENQLKEKGLTMKDVIYLRVYIVADKNKNNAFDYQGWFDAYAQFFGTAANPTKPSRSTVGVAGLVNPEWLIEIEAFAVYP